MSQRWLVAAAGVVVLLLAGCSLQEDVSSESPAASAAPTAAPVIEGTLLSGRQLNWSALHGKPIVLDFWGSWCSPCRAEQPDINTVYRQFASRGVVFVGVDIRDDTASAAAYQRDFSVPYQSVADTSEQISAAYNVEAPPTIVVIDQRGLIVDRFLGTVVGLSQELDSLLR